ncbi:MAG: IPTL-CTERM sorting domain-containing protein [Burkholderiales bacterium]
MATLKTIRPGSGLRASPLFAALAAAGLVAPLASHAATIVVTHGGDAGSGSTCTLRQAVAMIDSAGGAQGTCANSSVDAFGVSDQVDLSGLSGVITLSGTEIGWSNESIRFVGPAAGPATLRISGNGQSRVFNALLGGGGNITQIENLTIENGRSAGAGGCVLASSLNLGNSIVTGCVAEPSPQKYIGLAWGGGIAANVLSSEQSTIANNSAVDGGGGAFAKYADFENSTVANNTVTGSSCSIVNNAYSKYECTVKSPGGGGVLAGVANFNRSTISGNTVNATFFDYTSNDPTDLDAHLGIGGGVTVLGAKYIFGYDAAVSKATLKPTFAKAKATLMATERGRRAVAAFEANAEARAKARSAWRSAAKDFRSTSRAPTDQRARSKVDGYQLYSLGLFASTVSGNRVQGPNNPAVNGKYVGGGVASLAVAYEISGGGASYKYLLGTNNDEIANSTISGNRLPFFPPPPDNPPPDGTPQKGSAGAAFFGGPVDFSNSTIVDNTSQIAGVAIFAAGVPNARTAKVLGGGAFERMWRTPSGTRTRTETPKVARNKDFTPMVWESTIIANNPGIIDTACSGDPDICAVGGSNNLIRRPGMAFPPDTIVGRDPKLAPLANYGGTVTGAAGHGTTGPLKTHILYSNSPALDAGINLEGFPFDERGTGFPRTLGPGTDIGAVEGSIPSPVVPVPALGPWMLGLLSALLGALGLARRRRPAR